MNVTKYVGSLLVTFSDAGSTPAASTIYLADFKVLTVFVPPLKVVARQAEGAFAKTFAKGLIQDQNSFCSMNVYSLDTRPSRSSRKSVPA